MIEKEITINSYGINLSGTICLPSEEGRFPVVLMIHGSGPIDRDENMLMQKLNVFNTIAHSLAKQGIASLRYDKRGCGKSSGDFYKAVHFDIVNDAISCFDFLKMYELFESNKIFLLGHSEGCIISPQVSLKRPEVAGMILLCPFMDDIETTLIKQAGHIEKEFNQMKGLGGWIRKVFARMMGLNVQGQQKLINKIKASTQDVMRVSFQKFPAKSFRELISLDPPAIFRQVSQPMLIIGGEKDLQCDPADIKKIADLVNAPVESHVIKNLTHVLRFDEREATLLGSADLISKPMEKIILETIEQWLLAQNKKVAL